MAKARNQTERWWNVGEADLFEFIEQTVLCVIPDHIAPLAASSVRIELFVKASSSKCRLFLMGDQYGPRMVQRTTDTTSQDHESVAERKADAGCRKSNHRNSRLRKAGN